MGTDHEDFGPFFLHYANDFFATVNISQAGNHFIIIFFQG